MSLCLQNGSKTGRYIAVKRCTLNIVQPSSGHLPNVNSQLALGGGPCLYVNCHREEQSLRCPCYCPGTVAKAIHHRDCSHGDLEERQQGAAAHASVFSSPMVESCCVYCRSVS